VTDPSRSFASEHLREHEPGTASTRPGVEPPVHVSARRHNAGVPVQR